MKIPPLIYSTNEVGGCSLEKLFQAPLRAEVVLRNAENPTKNAQLTLNIYILVTAQTVHFCAFSRRWIFCSTSAVATL